MFKSKKWKEPDWKPIPGIGRAGFANSPCNGKKSDGTPCNRKALAGGYYCKDHTPKP